MSDAWQTLWLQPALPSAAGLPVWVALSWGLCAAAVCWVLADRFRPAGLWRTLAFVALLSLCWPATRAWTAWLALALQTPSLLGLGWLLLWAGRVTRRQKAPAPRMPWAWALAGVVLGWGLWLDTLNLWPEVIDVPLFAWGFSAVACWTVLVAAAWTALRTARAGASSAFAALLLAVLALFALTRWPSGNVWDALLDPWVWLGCHAVCVRAGLAWRASRAQR